MQVLLALAVLGGLAFYAAGPYVLKPGRDAADAVCRSAMDDEPDYWTEWKLFPLAHWECASSTAPSKDIGWWP